MRIVIDINGITETSGGMGNYIRLLVANLAEIDSRNEYLLYLHQWRARDAAVLERVLPRRPNFRLVFRRIPNVVSLFADYKLDVGLTEFLFRGAPGTVFHGPANIVPKLKTVKSVVTIHHYVPLGDPLYAKNLDARSKFYFGVTEQGIRSAERVIAVSGNTRKDLLEQLGVPAEKVTVVYPGGPHPVYRRIPDCVLPPALAAKLPGKYALFPGPVNDRKNLPAFLEAFASVKDKLEGWRLAITSAPAPEFVRRIAELEAKLSLQGRIALLGELTDSEMAIVYNRAECLVYPSLFEGFGSPPLEAMACGCPVAASAVTAIPEVTAGAALLFDPHDRGAMAQALLKVSLDEGVRRDLTAKGLVRVKDFSWRRMSQEIHKIYEEVSAGAN